MNDWTGQDPSECTEWQQRTEHLWDQGQEEQGQDLERPWHGRVDPSAHGEEMQNPRGGVCSKSCSECSGHREGLAPEARWSSFPASKL